MNTAQIQHALRELGYDPGPVDGIPGPKTTAAVKRFQQASGLLVDGIVGPLTEAELKAAVILNAGPPKAPQADPAAFLVPVAWLPKVTMKGITWHWSAGAYTASGLDKSHYHIIIEGSGALVRGVDIAKNAAPLAKGYAAHTKGRNTGIIGVSLACMAGAVESPFNAGKFPMKPIQHSRLPIVLADLCRFYRIEPTRENVLSHAEVERTLGIKQNGKWDTAWFPGMDKPGDAITLGDEIRAAVRKLL